MKTSQKLKSMIWNGGILSFFGVALFIINTSGDMGRFLLDLDMRLNSVMFIVRKLPTILFFLGLGIAFYAQVQLSELLRSEEKVNTPTGKEPSSVTANMSNPSMNYVASEENNKNESNENQQRSKKVLTWLILSQLITLPGWFIWAFIGMWGISTGDLSIAFVVAPITLSIIAVVIAWKAYKKVENSKAILWSILSIIAPIFLGASIYLF